MHEYSVASALLREVEATAASHGAGVVHRVHLKIGARSGVEVDLLAAAFELVRPRSVCARAELEIEVAPAVWACPLCSQTLAEGQPLRCPACRLPARMVSGDEILLQRLEMEVA